MEESVDIGDIVPPARSTKMRGTNQPMKRGRGKYETKTTHEVIQPTHRGLSIKAAVGGRKKNTDHRGLIARQAGNAVEIDTDQSLKIKAESMTVPMMTTTSIMKRQHLLKAARMEVEARSIASETDLETGHATKKGRSPVVTGRNPEKETTTTAPHDIVVETRIRTGIERRREIESAHAHAHARRIVYPVIPLNQRQRHQKEN
jgi:hypothetical protein